MAKKKKSTGSRRRRRVSGVGGSMMTTTLAAVAGAFASKMITKAVGSKLDPKIVAGAQLLAAAMFIPKMIKGPMGAGIAAGVAANAGTQLLSSLGVLSGVADFYKLPTVNGLPKVSGNARQVLAGVDLVKNSADVRKFRPSNHNFATGGNQLSLLSGIQSEMDARAEMQ